MKPGGDAGLLPGIQGIYETDPVAIPVEVAVCGLGEQEAWLRDGRADVAFMHLPYDDLSGFDTEALREDGQVAVFPSGHRLAERTSVFLEDLRGEPLPQWPGMAPDEATGPEVRDGAQLMQLIAFARVVAVLPESAVPYLRRDLVALPVEDAPRRRWSSRGPNAAAPWPWPRFVRAAAALAEPMRASHRTAGVA